MDSKKTVLVIEDEASIADNITFALTKESLKPIWVSTGQEGLERLRGEQIDLIIIDVGLPDMSGFDLIKEIREFSNLPVLFLTARSDEIDRVVGLELGADDYITKPFSPRELAARVKANLRRSSGEGFVQEQVEKAVFRVDENRKQISYYEKRLELSFYEYKILSLLISRPGWVYTREKIMEMVWEDNEGVFDRTVDAHIKSIRAKLKVVKEGIDPIVTHRGFGYSLREGL